MIPTCSLSSDSPWSTWRVWEVFGASSAAEGLEMARDLVPDVVLVDLMMPQMDGYEFGRRLKSDPTTAGVPLVLLTARTELDKVRLAEAGVAGVLFKPFQPEKLAQQVRSCVGDGIRFSGSDPRPVRSRLGRSHRGHAVLPFPASSTPSVRRMRMRCPVLLTPSSARRPALGRRRWRRRRRELENLALGISARKSCGTEERVAATAALARIEEAARKYQSSTLSTEKGSLAARMAVVGELTSLINATFDLKEIFRSAILKIRRVLDFRRASVVLTDEASRHYYLHTVYDSLRGGFMTDQAVFFHRTGPDG